MKDYQEILFKEEIQDLRNRINRIDSMIYDLWVAEKKRQATGKLV